MPTYTTVKPGDIYTGTNGQTGTVISAGSTITIDTGERLGYPHPYGATRTLTFFHSSVPGTITPAN